MPMDIIKQNDCFTLKSLLARHYTDYSPERLKKIYDKANLQVLS
jgi:hypothetical protein